MEVQMKNRLSRTGIIVVHDSETMLGNTQLASQFRRHLENMTNKYGIVGTQVKAIHCMFFRDKQQVDRSHRSNIFNGYQVLVLVYLFHRDLSGYHPTEQAVFHIIPLA